MRWWEVAGLVLAALEAMALIGIIGLGVAGLIRDVRQSDEEIQAEIKRIGEGWRK